MRVRLHAICAVVLAVAYTAGAAPGAPGGEVP